MEQEIKKKPEAERGVASRVKMIAALAEGDKAQLARSVSRYLSDRSPRVRAAALDAVREGELRQMDAEVRTLLRDESRSVRSSAVECLGALHEGDAVGASWLYPLLTDPFYLVRIETLESLAQIGDSAALPLIVERLTDDDPLVRAYAARSIAELHGTEFLTAIERASKTETSENAKVGFADALFALGDERQFPRLLEFLASTDYHVRCAAANALSVAALTPVQLKAALEAVSHAARHSLAVADKSTMERVEKELREQA
jgi:HEAT repeat protein